VSRARSAGKAQGDQDRLLRNAASARRLHAATYLSTAFLLLSGVAVGEGIRSLELLLGGHVASAAGHRWVGVALIGGAAAVLAIRPRSVMRFLAESLRFRRGDVRWFATWPAFVLQPGRSSLARHEGHFDPGQRVLNVVIVMAFLVLSATGVVMTVPRLVVPAAFGFSLRLHRAAMWVLGGAVAGHLVVALGVLPSYRGVWRAMHWGGRVRGDLARTLWPRWAEDASDRRGDRPRP
jgi:cytochrome b subunit of formate dehydrogenase